jgi:hypothetical protein
MIPRYLESVPCAALVDCRVRGAGDATAAGCPLSYQLKGSRATSLARRRRHSSLDAERWSSRLGWLACPMHGARSLPTSWVGSDGFCNESKARTSRPWRVGTLSNSLRRSRGVPVDILLHSLGLLSSQCFRIASHLLLSRHKLHGARDHRSRGPCAGRRSLS